MLVDDGSPDNAGVICDEYAERDSRFRVIHKVNEGVSAARNDGIDAAVGEWLYIIDSDDWLEPDAVEKVLAAAERDDVDCVMSYCEQVFPDGSTRRSAPFREPFIARGKESMGELQRYVLYQPYSSHYTPETKNGYAAPWGKLVRADKLKAANVCFDPALRGVFDDGLWSLYLFEAIDSMSYIHEKTYNYRIVQGSLIHSYKKNAIETQLLGYRGIEDFLRKFNKGPEFWQAYHAHVIAFFGGYLSRHWFNENNELPSFEVEADIKAALSDGPFYVAPRDVDRSVLRAKDKLLLLAMRHKSIGLCKAYLFLKRHFGGRQSRMV